MTAPDAVLNIKATAGDGNVDVRVLIKLSVVSMQCAENTDLNALLSGPAEHGTGGAKEQLIEHRPVIAEEGPQQVWNGEGDMLPFAVGQDVLLLRDALLS